MNNKDMPARAKCSYADKYKAVFPPRCGCAVCGAKRKAALAELNKQTGGGV